MSLTDRLKRFLSPLQQRTRIQVNKIEGGGTVIGEQHNTYIDGKDQETKKKEEVRHFYLERLRDACRQLPLSAVGAMKDEEDVITLEDVYIGLQTTEKVKETQDEKTLSAIECFERSPRLVLLGDPGSGKSTFVNHLLAQYADACLDSKKDTPAKMPALLTPVRIILRDLAASLNTTHPGGLTDDLNAVACASILENHAVSALSRLGAEAFAGPLKTAFQNKEVFLVLDGLDEVPTTQRLDMQRVVKAAVNTYKLKYLVVTCRIRSYQDEKLSIPHSEDVTLAPFNNTQKEQFAKAWYKPDVRKELTKVEADQKAADLTTAATSDELAEIAENPMLLTTMAIIHQRDTRLPDKRVELYDEAIQVMLWKWQKPKVKDGFVVSSELNKVLKDRRRILRALMRLAYGAHAARHTEKEIAGISWDNAFGILRNKIYMGSAGLAEEFLNYVDQRSGLLQGYGGSDSDEHPLSYGFPHRTFQEYLAGRYLMTQDVGTLLPTLSKDGSFWYEAIKLGLEDQVHLRTGERALLKEAYLLNPKAFPNDDETQRLVLWLGYIAELVGADVIEEDMTYPEKGGLVYMERMKAYLLELVSGTLPPIERAEAGRILGCIGDPRKELMTIEHMSFCYILSGSFQMGMKESILDWGESPETEEAVEYDYWMGQYPVTQAQFRQFVEKGGYENPDYWTETGWETKIKYKWEHPARFKKAFMLDNHPVVGISWYEAHAFCEWLNEFLGEKSLVAEGFRIGLARELEWEKAARGGHEVPEEAFARTLTDGLTSQDWKCVSNGSPSRMFPYDGDANPSHMNYFNSGIRRTSRPGCFVAGKSLYGVEDLSGNVREWCADKWSFEKPTSKDFPGRLLSPLGDSSRVLRGGSFVNNDNLCRCAFRYFSSPYGRFNDIGFRLVVRPLTSDLSEL